MSSKQDRRRRANLWHRDKRCFWCRRTTRLKRWAPDIGQRLPLDAATLDHLDSRFGDGKRVRTAIPAHALGRTVLSCVRCNERRSNTRAGEITDIEELRRLAALGWPE